MYRGYGLWIMPKVSPGWYLFDKVSLSSFLEVLLFSTNPNHSSTGDYPSLSQCLLLTILYFLNFTTITLARVCSAPTTTTNALTHHHGAESL